MAQLNYVRIEETFDDGSGAAASGWVIFTPSETVYASGVPVVAVDSPVKVMVLGGVLQSVELIATDNTPLEFLGQTGFFFWTAQVCINNVTQPEFSFFLPSSPSTVDLYSLASTGGQGGSVQSVSAGDASIVIGGSDANPTVETGSLSEIATLHPPVAPVPMNGQKLTGLGNGSASADSVAYGQLGSAAFEPTSAFDAAGAAATAQGNAEAASTPVLTQTGVKAATYAASANQIVPCNTTSGSFTVTLPNAPAVGTIVAVKHVIQGSTNAVTVACAGSDVFNKAGGSTTLTLSLLNQGILLQYDSGIWMVLSDDLPLSQMDARYASLSNTTDWINVKTEYGAACNAVNLVDAAMTASSATLTSVSATFTSADAGKTMYVAGAGPAGATLVTTISAFVNANTVTLAEAASTTVTAMWAVYGTDDTTAIEAAFAGLPSADVSAPVGGGVLYFPGFSLISSVLTPASNSRLTGDGWGRSGIISAASSVINAGPSGALDTVEVDHLTLSVLGSDLFTGANAKRWHVHDCQLVQNSLTNSLWGAASVAAFYENRFEKNLEVLGASITGSRTVPAWQIGSATTTPAINQNTWRDIVIFNYSGDASQYHYHLYNTGSGALRNPRFENIVFEHPNGGMIRLESASGSVIDECWCWDPAANGIENDLIYIHANATSGVAPVQNTIRTSGRLGSGLASGVADIRLDSNCVQTCIENCGEEGSGAGSPLVLNLGGSSKVTLIGLPSSYTISAAAASYADAYFNPKVDTAAAAPFASKPGAPTGTTSTSTVMMGLGATWTYTPASSGKCLITVTGLVTNSATGVSGNVGCRYGTGTAPANGAAGSGTRFGGSSDSTTRPQTGGIGVPFAFTDVLALTPGTAYWFDLALSSSNASDTESVSNLSITVVETS